MTAYLKVYGLSDRPLKDMGMAGLASVWAMARRRTKSTVTMWTRRRAAPAMSPYLTCSVRERVFLFTPPGQVQLTRAWVNLSTSYVDEKEEFLHNFANQYCIEILRLYSVRSPKNIQSDDTCELILINSDKFCFLHVYTRSVPSVYDVLENQKQCLLYPGGCRKKTHTPMSHSVDMAWLGDSDSQAMNFTTCRLEKRAYKTGHSRSGGWRFV